MYTVLDLETTGLSHEEDQVIEIGAVKLDKHFNELGTFSTYVKLREGKELPPFIIDYTGIKPEDLVDGMDEEEAFAKVSDFIGNDYVVAQFASFDLGFLPFGNDVDFICTKTIFMDLYPDKRSSLKNIVEHYGVKAETAHQALGDARMTASVLSELGKEVPLYEYINAMKKPADRNLRFVPDRAEVIKDGNSI